MAGVFCYRFPLCVYRWFWATWFPIISYNFCWVIGTQVLWWDDAKQPSGTVDERLQGIPLNTYVLRAWKRTSDICTSQSCPNHRELCLRHKDRVKRISMKTIKKTAFYCPSSWRGSECSCAWDRDRSIKHIPTAGTVTQARLCWAPEVCTNCWWLTPKLQAVWVPKLRGPKRHSLLASVWHHANASCAAS